MAVNEKIAYLKGLMDGMNVEGEQRKLFDAITAVLEEIDAELQEVAEDCESLATYIDDMDEDLSQVEETLFGDDDDEDDDDDCDCCDCDDCDCDEDDEEGYIDFYCPNCGARIIYDAESFDIEKDHLCPKCGAQILEPDEDEEE